LRNQAENIVRKKTMGMPESLKALSPAETRQALHELRIHQAELEMQNEDLRLAQMEIEAARTRYFELYDLAPVAYLTLSEKGLIMEANLTAANLLGTARGELVKKPFSRFVPREDQNTYYQQLKLLFETPLADSDKADEPQAWELRILKKDGTSFCAYLAARAAKNAAGAPVCRFVITDITVRKQAETLRTENERFSQVLNGLDALVYVIDMKTYNIVFINTYGKNIWGDIKGKICWQTIQAGQSGPCEFCTNSNLIGPDGNPTEGVVWEFQNTVNKRWYNCRDRAIYWPDGRIVRMEIATDITDRKQAEQELIETVKQLQETMDMLVQYGREAAIGRIAAGVAHEILNPASIISSQLQFLEEESLSETARRNVRVSREQLLRIVKISQDLQQSSPKQPGMLIRGDLRQVVEIGLQMTESRRGKDDVRLEYAPPSKSIPVKMAKESLVKVLVHLILNACDAMTANMKIPPANMDVNKEKILIVTIQYHEDSSQCLSVRLTVADNGQGIPSGYLNRIFDPFFTTKAPGKGTGLGLSICRSIILEHGGAIRAENNNMGGASFIVELPI